MVNCTNCGAPLKDGAKFCGACGVKAEARCSCEETPEVQRFCTECHAKLEPGEKFCTQSGVPENPQETDPSYFEAEDCDGGCRIRQYTGPEVGAVYIPSCIGGKKVVAIGEGAFVQRSSLTSITIPNGVTEIGGNAFTGCESLAKIIVPNGVTKIGEGAFAFCTSLAILILPDSLTEIGFQAFLSCESLISVTIPEGVTEIGSFAFQNCDCLSLDVCAGSAAEQYALDERLPFRTI